MICLLIFAFACCLSLTFSLPCDLSWFHAPKTGSTFCLSLQHACYEKQFTAQVEGMQETILRNGCVEIKPNGTMWGSYGHQPITGDYGNHVGLFRNPVYRLISGFDDSLHSEGMSDEEKLEIKSRFVSGPKLGHDKRKNAVAMTQYCVHNFNIWAAHPHNHGCYVKMLTGSECHAMVDLTPEMLQQAKETLRRFRFVGIMEDYDRSVEIFLKFVHRNWSTLYTPKKKLKPGEFNETAPVLPPFPVEVEKHRVAHNPCSMPLVEAQKLGLVHFNDSYDEAIYSLALELYEGFKDEYGQGLRRRELRR